MVNLRCPVCAGALEKRAGAYLCPKNHSFDIAKSGYVNLLLNSSQGHHGDDKLMVRARRDFLDKGYYDRFIAAVADAAAEFTPPEATVLDAGCGEGIYSLAVLRAIEKAGKHGELLGVDISKTALQYASKRSPELALCVASCAHLPVGDGIPASEQKKKNKREVLAGGILWILTVSLSFLVPAVLLFAAGKVHPAVRFLLETFWCYQIFAARCLVGESRKVYQKLKEDDLPGARRSVSMIVGRDTENLTAEGVTKAAVETVAENTSDGVTAPLLFLLIGGAPLGFLYKAVNTMDSMLGYKNEKYLYFGRIPAKMDDVFNYIPARLTAWFMIAAAFLTGMDGKNAWKIYLRDKRKHASPNSAQSEAVCAGALDVQLAGDAVYFGKIYKKDYIGDAIRKIEPEDILRAGKLMYMTTILMMVVFGGLLLWIY